MLSVAEATRAVLDRVTPLAIEPIALEDACGTVLGAPIVATRASPGFDNSAMDGYGARAADLPATLPLVGTSAAGDAVTVETPARSAIRIFTGAPVPPGVDTVVIQEDATREGDQVTLPAARAGDNIRRAGEDLAVGETVMAEGTRLTPWELGVLAALGIARVPCRRAPRIALIATGDELVDVTTVPGPGQLVNSSSYALDALVRAAGGIPIQLGIVRDDPAALAAMLATALTHDAVITTGGVSVGERDHVRDAFTTAGITLDLWKVAMKPGKPFAFGRGAGREPLVFGLPGNPVSTVVAFELFVRPAILAMQGAAVTARPRAPVYLVGGYRKPAGRAHYLRARLTRDGDRLIAHAHPKQGSAMLASLVGCNALVEVPAEVTVVPPDGTAMAILLEAV